MNPKSLIDEAFLRRISHKLAVDDLNRPQYRTIFIDVCQARGIEFNEQTFNYLLGKWYDEADRPMRACHPRDLVKQIINFAIFRSETPAEMTVDLIDRAARSYFAELF